MTFGEVSFSVPPDRRMDVENLVAETGLPVEALALAAFEAYLDRAGQARLGDVDEPE